VLLSSSAFQAGDAIPIRFTCEGEDISPEFSWRGAPAESESFVLTLRDSDASRAGGFTHWVVYNIPASMNRIEENVPKWPTVAALGLQGKNDSGQIGYMGPCLRRAIAGRDWRNCYTSLLTLFCVRFRLLPSGWHIHRSSRHLSSPWCKSGFASRKS
jgi:hypothetical protein